MIHYFSKTRFTFSFQRWRENKDTQSNFFPDLQLNPLVVEIYYFLYSKKVMVIKFSDRTYKVVTYSSYYFDNY